MKVRMLQTTAPIFIPDGGGSTNYYFRDNAYDISQEGAFVRVRVKGRPSGKVHSVPMANVACLELADAPANDNATAPVPPPLAVAVGAR